MFKLQPFPPYPAASAVPESVPLPETLPAPVRRFFQRIMGNQVPILHSTILTGRGKLRFKGVPFQARWRFTHLAGQGYRHYIEAAILGQPALKVNESYVDGHSHFELPFGTLEDDPNTTEAANLALWAESIWLPSIFVTDPRVRWEPVDNTTARLVIPFGSAEDAITVTFDPKTDLVQRMDAKRFRDQSDKQKIPWRNDVYDWKEFHGICVPSQATVTWLDQGSPWFELSVDEIVYNADVSQYIYARGL